MSRQGGLEDEGSACPYCAEECGDWSRVLLHLEATACDEAAELAELSGSWQARVQQKKELAKRKAREARRLALAQCGGGHLLRVNHHPASANARCDRCAAVSTRYRCTEVRRPPAALACIAPYRAAEAWGWPRRAATTTSARPALTGSTRPLAPTLARPREPLPSLFSAPPSHGHPCSAVGATRCGRTLPH